MSNLTNGETFDADNVCANQNKGYVYVQSNCSSSVTLAVTFSEESYQGPVCLNIAGTQLSGMPPPFLALLSRPEPVSELMALPRRLGNRHHCGGNLHCPRHLLVGVLVLLLRLLLLPVGPVQGPPHQLLRSVA